MDVFDVISEISKDLDMTLICIDEDYNIFKRD
jgi:hypothetical protein